MNRPDRMHVAHVLAEARVVKIVRDGDASYPRWALVCGQVGGKTLLARYADGSVALDVLWGGERMSEVAGNVGLGDLFLQALAEPKASIEFVDIRVLESRDQVRVIRRLAEIGSWVAAKHVKYAACIANRTIARAADLDVLIRAAAYPKLRKENERGEIERLVEFAKWPVDEHELRRSPLPYAAAIVALANQRHGRELPDPAAAEAVVRCGALEEVTNSGLLDFTWKKEADQLSRRVA